MPAKVSNISRAPRSLEYLFATEGRMLPRPTNNIGQVPFASDGSVSSTAWAAAPTPTVTANTWKRYLYGALAPAVGRCYVVTSITVAVTAACELQLLHLRTLQSMLAGPAGINYLDSFNCAYEGTTSGAGSYTWTFQGGLYIHSGERVDLYGLVTGTTGINFEISWTGSDLTDDFDFDAPNTLLVLGDSIAGVTSEMTDFSYLRREDGTENGMWPFIVKARLAEIGKRTRLVNIAVGGTNSYEWDWLASQGRIGQICAQAAVVNVGMNNATTDVGLSASAGTDGPHKKALKNIARAYFRANSGGSLVFNNITATDVSAQLTAVASGMYAGQTRLAAYRAETAAVVSDLQAAGARVALAATDLAYTSSTSGAFISTEIAGNRKHPSGAIGQPAIAERVWTALQTLPFVTG